MKKHEDWLKGKFGSTWSGKDKDENYVPGTKLTDQWAKDHMPGAYPHLKGMADAKSSKNYLGMADKVGYGFDKEMTKLPEIDEKAQHEGEQKKGQQPPPESQGDSPK